MLRCEGGHRIGMGVVVANVAGFLARSGGLRSCMMVKAGGNSLVHDRQSDVPVR